MYNYSATMIRCQWTMSTQFGGYSSERDVAVRFIHNTFINGHKETEECILSLNKSLPQ